MRIVFYLILTLALAPATLASAGSEPEYSSDEFVRAILSGPAPCPPEKTPEACEASPKTRRFSLPTKHPRASAAAVVAPLAKPKAAAPKPRRAVKASDVLVTFASGSANLTQQGKDNLKSIAAGLMTAALSPIRFEIAGFTDASGKPETNGELSKQRAVAVKAFLVSLNVPERRLTTAGYGSEHLIDPDEPVSEANRRVELHRLN